MKVWYEVETKEGDSWIELPRRHAMLSEAEYHIEHYIVNPDNRIVKVTETREVVE